MTKLDSEIVHKLLLTLDKSKPRCSYKVCSYEEKSAYH